MRPIVLSVAFITSALLLTACGTTDTARKDQGHPEAYVTGFHDGRHSGMEEACNNWEHMIKDHDRFENDKQYRAGWIAGETEGKRLQAQAIGEAAGDGYTGYRVGQEVDAASPHPKKIAKDAMQGVDTSELNKLGK